MLESGLAGKLGEIVGNANILVMPGDIERYGADARRGRGGDGVPSYAVVLPRDAGEVAAVVGLAFEEGLPLVPRGGGTGLRGGAVPSRGGIVVSTERMTDSAEIHREDLYVVVSAGVVTADLRRQVEARGLFYPIDPASQASSTIGGNVADAAVGMHGVKYGTTRNYLLGLEMVTPEGKILKAGAKTVKSVAGYDLTRLAVGAQGILGVVTSVTLKILPMPEERRVLVFAFPDGAQAAAAASEIIADGFQPAALEIADRATVSAVRRSIGDGMGVGGDAQLLMEFHGIKPLCNGEASKVKEMMGAHFDVEVTAEAGYPEAEDLWKVRGGALAALAKTSPTAIVIDLALSHGRMEGMLREIGEISRRYETSIAVFGHAGEGVLHAVVPMAEAAISEVTAACVNLGGAVWADKGIGLAGASAPAVGLSETGREVLTILKKSIDPKDIMNSGKLLGEGR